MGLRVRRRRGGLAHTAICATVPRCSGLGGALADAVDSLPALMNRKRMLGQHTNILRAVMAQVAARHVPTYYELEKQIVAGTAVRASPCGAALSVASTAQALTCFCDALALRSGQDSSVRTAA